MNEELANRLLAAFMGRGATISDIGLLCQQLESDRKPELSWLAFDAHGSVTPGQVSPRLYNLLETHCLLTHTALQLFSRNELGSIWNLGTQLLDELMAYCTALSIEPRKDTELFVARAEALYGSINAVPVTPVLAVVFKKPVYNVNRYGFIRYAVEKTGATTLGGLVEVLATCPMIDGLLGHEYNLIRNWLRDNHIG